MTERGIKMNKQEQQEFVNKEIVALFEDLDNTINQLIILRPFLKNVLNVINGVEPFYKFNEIPKDPSSK